MSTSEPRPPIEIVPVGLRVDGKLVLVVGAGRIAARKAKAYGDRGALLSVVAPEFSPEMDALDIIDRRERPFEPADLDGVWFVVTATGLPAVDGAVFREAEARRVWWNAADDPGHCTVILPSEVRRDGLTITVSTGGRSPATATWLRRRINAMLDEGTVGAFETAAGVRDEMRAEGVPTEVPGWQEALDAFEADLRSRLGRDR